MISRGEMNFGFDLLREIFACSNRESALFQCRIDSSNPPIAVRCAADANSSSADSDCDLRVSANPKKISVASKDNELLECCNGLIIPSYAQRFQPKLRSFARAVPSQTAIGNGCHMGFRARSLHCALEHVRRGDAGTQATGGKIMRVGSHHAFEQLWACHAEGGIMRTCGHAGRTRRG